MKTKKIQDKERAISRRTFSKKTLGGIAALLSGATFVIYKHFSNTPLYARARDNPVLQKQWVSETLKKYSIDDLFGDVIIITPENAHIYQHEYDRAKHLGELVTFTSAKAEELTTNNVPRPKLYIPTEIFKIQEKDLVTYIAYHEASHAEVLVQGFDFGGINNFQLKNDPAKIGISMFNVTLELEGHEEQLKKGSEMMSEPVLRDMQQQYLKHYIQLWRYGETIRGDVTEMLKAKYFQPWMKKSDSLMVYHDTPNNLIRYGGIKPFPFFVCDDQNTAQQCYIQFEFLQLGKSTIHKLPLPSTIR